MDNGEIKKTSLKKKGGKKNGFYSTFKFFLVSSLTTVLQVEKVLK